MGNLMKGSVLLTDSAVSLKWITVTLKIEMQYKHRANCSLEAFGGGEFESHVRFVD